MTESFGGRIVLSIVFVCLCLPDEFAEDHPRAGDVFSLARPPDARTIVVASGSHAAAAGMVVWMRVVQRISDRSYIQEGFPYLSQWLQTVQSLVPEAVSPTAIGALVLGLEAARPMEADALLASAESTHPHVAELSFWRGALAYFGRGNVADASRHLGRAADNGAPPFVRRLATTLTEQRDCEKSLRFLAAAADPVVQRRMASLAQSCARVELERASGAFRLRFGRGAKDIDELLQSGVLKNRPTSPAGSCWILKGPKASLETCRP